MAKDPYTGIDHADLDRYITGEDQTRTEIYELRCVNGHKWKVKVTYEMGSVFYEDEDKALCPECGEPDVLETDR